MRREAIKALLLGAAASTVVASPASAQSQCAVCYPQVPEEVASSVVPSNTSYPPGNIRRYHSGGNDWTSALRQLNKVAAHGLSCFIPKGTYTYSYNDGDSNPANREINWAIQGLQLTGERGTILRFVGTGRAFVLDASAGAPVYAPGQGINIGNLIIEGNAAATDGLYCLGVMRSAFRFIEVRNVTAKAFHIKFGVLNHFDTCIFSTNIPASPPPLQPGPTHGFYLDSDGMGNYTSTCTFTNCIVEGLPQGKGCALVHASNNVFVGGSFEGVAIGIDFDTNQCHRNRFVNMWFEQNKVADARIMGTGNSFAGCYFCSLPTGLPTFQPNISIIDAGGTTFEGGLIRHVDAQSQGRHTLFLGVAVPDHPVSHGQQAFTGSASYKRVGVVAVDTNGNVVGSLPDVVG